jgi:hypothetical protein
MPSPGITVMVCVAIFLPFKRVCQIRKRVLL